MYWMQIVAMIALALILAYAFAPLGPMQDDGGAND